MFPQKKGRKKKKGKNPGKVNRRTWARCSSGEKHETISHARKKQTQRFRKRGKKLFEPAKENMPRVL